mmetsp:Transcript_16431/g.39003  ORF Transcript_16431/g.39003 Transcript_16431/m.39003 type:complete len:354 (-) Transcript_16431:250-1311(-)
MSVLIAQNSLKGRHLVLQLRGKRTQLGLQHRQVLLLHHPIHCLCCAHGLKGVPITEIPECDDDWCLVWIPFCQQHVRSKRAVAFVTHREQSNIAGKLGAVLEDCPNRSCEAGPLKLSSTIHRRPGTLLRVGHVHTKPDDPLWAIRARGQDHTRNVLDPSHVHLVPWRGVALLTDPCTAGVQASLMTIMNWMAGGSLASLRRNTGCLQAAMPLGSEATCQGSRQGNSLVKRTSVPTQSKQLQLFRRHANHGVDLHPKHFPSFAWLALDFVFRALMAQHEIYRAVWRWQRCAGDINRSWQGQRKARIHDFAACVGIQQLPVAVQKNNCRNAADTEHSGELELPRTVCEGKGMPRH